MAKKEEKKTEETALAKQPETVALAEGDFDYGDYAGQGYENQDMNDRKVPFIEVLQPLSPIVMKNEARAGDFRNTITGKIYDGKKGILITPVTTKRTYVEWVPKDKGGGFRGQHEPGSKRVQDVLARVENRFGKLPIEIDPKDNKPSLELVETYYMPSILHDEEDGPQEVMIACASMKIGPYKELQSKLASLQDLNPKTQRKFQCPMFSFVVRATTELQNHKNYTFHNIRFAPKTGDNWKAPENRLPLSSEAFQRAVKLREGFNAGATKVDYSSQGQVGSEKGEEESPMF